MKTSLFNEIKQTPGFLGYLSGSIAFILFWIITELFGYKYSILEAYSPSSLIIGLGLIALFTYQIKGLKFSEIREQSARNGLTFLVIITFSLSISSDENNPITGDYFLIPGYSFLIPYLISFLIMIVIKPFVSK